jgi:site-specific DNA recombinase
MRAALYARYSSDMQSPSSIDDQLRVCRRLAAELGVEVVGEWSDAAISGSTLAARPGLNALLEAARRRPRPFDLVIAEHTDRLSRSGEDSYALYRTLTRGLGIVIRTVNQGEISPVLVGVNALTSELFLDELARKTRRGLEGAARAGRVAGRAFGYRIAKVYDAAGERIKGAREVDPAEAEVVARIYSEYAGGLSPEAIAGRLNADGIPGPTGRLWSGPTIRGSPNKGTGVINNQLYRGVFLWGRQTYHKDRKNGPRGSRLPPVEEVVRVEHPELRIVPEALWEAVQARQDSLRRKIRVADGHRAELARRPKRLLSSLVRCGLCSRPMILHSDRGLKGPDGHRWLCQAKRTYGPDACPGNRTARANALEARVMAALKDKLLHPDAVEAYVREYRAEAARLNRERERGRGEADRELAEVDRRAARLVDQVAEGQLSGKAVAAKLADLERRREELQARVQALPAAEVVALHPEAAGRYRKAVEELQAALAGPDSVERAHSRETVRALIRAVYIHPGEKWGQYRAEILLNIGDIFPTAAGDAAVRLIA